VSTRPIAYAKMPNVRAAIAANPVARPSRPSARLTVFALPATTIATKNGNTAGTNTMLQSLKNGSIVSVAGYYIKNNPSARPSTNCQKSLYRAMSPRVCFRTIFR